jgi:TfoX/Sxy family transcriptional regulator of competence genes
MSKRSRQAPPQPDDELTIRIRELLHRRKGITEKRMFGGVCFLADGNMIGGTLRAGALLLRVGPDAQEACLALEHVGPMTFSGTFTGRPMKNFVQVDAPALEADADLKAWLERGLAYARSLPPK